MSTNRPPTPMMTHYILLMKQVNVCGSSRPLTANNSRHFVVVSTLQASTSRFSTQDGLLTQLTHSQHNPCTLQPGALSERQRPRPCPPRLPRSNTTSTPLLNSPTAGVSLRSVRLGSQGVPPRTSPRHSSGSATSSVK